MFVVSGYVVIYYRLMVRHFYQQQYQVKESTFAALFSFPPYARLDSLGRKYARRYWMAVIALVVFLLLATYLSDFASGPFLGQSN